MFIKHFPKCSQHYPNEFNCTSPSSHAALIAKLQSIAGCLFTAAGWLINRINLRYWSRHVWWINASKAQLFAMVSWNIAVSRSWKTLNDECELGRAPVIAQYIYATKYNVRKEKFHILLIVAVNFPVSPTEDANSNPSVSLLGQCQYSQECSNVIHHSKNLYPAITLPTLSANIYAHCISPLAHTSRVIEMFENKRGVGRVIKW